MSRRKRKSATRRRWLWVLGTVVGATAAYLVALRLRADSALPIPGQVSERAAPSPAPKEEIRNSERDALDRVLRERSRAH
jgi:surfactin synthase thioesterase subunit